MMNDVIEDEKEYEYEYIWKDQIEDDEEEGYMENKEFIKMKKKIFKSKMELNNNWSEMKCFHICIFKSSNFRFKLWIIMLNFLRWNLFFCLIKNFKSWCNIIFNKKLISCKYYLLEYKSKNGIKN